MIQVLSTQGWCDYCDLGVKTDLLDANGNILHTGDVVEVITYEWGEDQAEVIGVAMIVFDQHKRFIGTDRFFVSGWLNQNWSECVYALNRVDISQLPDNFHYRIREVEK